MAPAQSYDLEEELEAIVSAASCSRIAARVAQQNGDVVLSGVAQSEAARLTVIEQAQALAGVDVLHDEDLVTIEAPCALMRFIHFVDNLGAHTALVAPGKGLPPVRVVHAGDQVQFNLRTPEYPSYILLDYFSNGGDVYHLDSQNWPLGPFQGNQDISFGGAGERGVPVTATPPFGREMMMAVASSAPLIEQPRGQRDNIGAYAIVLGDAIQRAVEAGENVEVFIKIIHTQPRADALASSEGTAPPNTQ